ncbi:MAG: hypothetical protein J6E32_00235 [Lachnospiraceae bacterium]|nr:hypothetical protein [Lachnospiraceae bacterium]
MASQTVNYKCPSCGGPLHYDSASGKLKCDYCLSVYTPDEISSMYSDEYDAADKNQNVEYEQQAQADVMSHKGDEITVGGKWDSSTIPADWGEDSANMVAYTCQSCGGEILAEASTAATSCPYCGNPTIIPSQLSGQMRPQYIIPFKLDQNAAMEAYRKYCKRKILLPKTFSTNSTVEKLRGIYIPFWLFDSHVSGDYSFLGSVSTSNREGDYIVTRTREFSIRRSLEVGYRGIPTDASRNMPDDLMDSLEPYDYSQMKAFATSYLPGYLADRSDVSIEESSDRAKNRAVASAQNIAHRDAQKGPYTSVLPYGSRVSFEKGEVHYALLPVYILKVAWDGKNYLYAMNGQTGKFVGDLPVAKGRFFGLFTGITGALFVVFYFIVQFILSGF